MPEADTEHGDGLPVGEYLRSVRESRGLQVEDVSRVTKIGTYYLVAIEAGQFDKLPNVAYLKGFLRLYASFLALSGDEVVARYLQNVPPVRPAGEPKSEPPGVEIVEPANPGGHGRWLIPALLLGLVLLATLFLSDNDEKQQRPTRKRPEIPSAQPVKAAVLQQRFSTAAARGALPAPTVPPARSVPAGEPHRDGIILRLHFNRDSWLSMTIDDSISQRYDLKAGDIIEWKGARLFVLDIGDGAAVEAEFNGRQLKALGEPGKPAHLELKAE